MDDPFGLSLIQKPLVSNYSQDNSTLRPPVNRKKRALFWVFGVFAFLLFSSIGGYFVFGKKISADTTSDTVKMQLTGLSAQVSSAEEMILTVQIDSSADYKGASLEVYSEGLTFDLKTLDGAQTLSTQRLSELSEAAKTGFSYNVDIVANQKKQVQFKVTTASINNAIDVFARLSGKSDAVKCGPFNLLECSQNKVNLLSSTSASAKVSQTTEVSLRKGWSIIGIPYLMEKTYLGDLFLGLKSRKSYIFDPQSGGYIDLVDNISKGKTEVLDPVVPGRGILVYSALGEQVSLPADKTATNPNQEFRYNLKIGYNFLANPYANARIVFSSNIMVQKLSDDGTPTGQTITYKEAVETNVIALPTQVVMKSYTDSANETAPITDSADFKQISYETKISPFSGFVIEAKQPAQIILNSDNLARADLLSETRIEQIQKCLATGGLDEYGNRKGTVYPEGAPLDKNGEKYTNPLDSIIDQNLDKTC